MDPLTIASLGMSAFGAISGKDAQDQAAEAQREQTAIAKENQALAKERFALFQKFYVPNMENLQAEAEKLRGYRDDQIGAQGMAGFAEAQSALRKAGVADYNPYGFGQTQATKRAVSDGSYKSFLSSVNGAILADRDKRDALRMDAFGRLVNATNGLNASGDAAMVAASNIYGQNFNRASSAASGAFQLAGQQGMYGLRGLFGKTNSSPTSVQYDDYGVPLSSYGTPAPATSGFDFGTSAPGE